MQDCLMTEATQALMPMNNLDLLSNDNVPEDGEEREHCWHGCLPINDQKGYMVDFQAVRQIPNASAALVSMSDDDYFMPPVDQFLP